MTLLDAWGAEATHWVEWSRRPGQASHWRFHRDRFLELLPPPNGPLLDVGCGEGRLPRVHRPLEAYSAALESAGLLIERLVEVPDATDPPGDRWRRIPLFLRLRALNRGSDR
jgi:hypothetical protein